MAVKGLMALFMANLSKSWWWRCGIGIRAGLRSESESKASRVADTFPSFDIGGVERGRAGDVGGVRIDSAPA